MSDRFGKGGIADRMIWFNGFPFLDNKEDHNFAVPVSHVMMSELRTLPASGLDVKHVEKIMNDSKVQGFPIVEDSESNILVGYIGRTELRYALDRAKREQSVPGHARCFFTPEAGRQPVQTPSTATPAVTFDNIAETSGQMSVDLSKFVELSPITVHPRLPLETVMELFKKLGPRVILIEYRGRLTGLVTVKDCLKYQFQVEAHENPRDDSILKEGQERLYQIMRKVALWVDGKLGFVRHGRVRLGAHVGLSPRVSDPGRSPSISQGMDDVDARALELDDRYPGGGTGSS